jgi:nuclear pore complex protein Nup205
MKFIWYSYLDARLWSVYKEISNTVDAAIYKQEPEAVHDLEAVLRRHKPDFLSLLKNPVRKLA